LYSIYGATTPVELPDACLQGLLLGLLCSCSNTNCQVNRRDNCAKRQVTAVQSSWVIRSLIVMSEVSCPHAGWRRS